jgi:CHAT domain-containing protein
VRDADAERLMRAFHSHYRRHGDAAASLRAAQVDFIDSGSPPSVWAAFRYAGR